VPRIYNQAKMATVSTDHHIGAAESFTKLSFNKTEGQSISLKTMSGNKFVETTLLTGSLTNLRQFFMRLSCY